MKLILTADVPNLGAPGDLVEVKDGYGRNFLVPQGLAIAATRGAEKQVATIRRAREARTVRDLAHANEIKQSLQGLSITLPAHAGDNGKLFGSVTAADVADAVQEQTGIELDRRKVVLDEPIRELGDSQVQVRLPAEVVVAVAVVVVAE